MLPHAHAQARTHAIELLCQAQARGDLSVEAFETRFGLIQEATNAAMIEAIVADLIPVTPAEPLPVLARDEQYGLEAYPDYTPADVLAVSDDPLRITAVFGSAQRAGPWTVPPSIKCLAIFGSLQLDFREAEFLSDGVDLEISSYVAEVKITVPLDVKIDHDIRGVMNSIGHSRSRAKAAVVPAITIWLHGDALLADIKIKEKDADPIDRIPFEGLNERVKGWLGKGRRSKE
jgi:hypothetical protein